jgi:hypothetical protein
MLIGIAIGIGALIAGALIVSEASLFSASPLLTPFALMGRGGFIGGFLGRVIGASAGAGQHHGRIAKRVEKAICHGDAVRVAQTHNAEETTMAGDQSHCRPGQGPQYGHYPRATNPALSPLDSGLTRSGSARYRRTRCSSVPEPHPDRGLDCPDQAAPNARLAASTAGHPCRLRACASPPVHR